MLFAEADAAAAVDKLFYLGEAATDLLLVALIASAAVTAYSAVKERSVRSAFYAFAMFPLILSKLSILVYFAANALQLKTSRKSGLLPDFREDRSKPGRGLEPLFDPADGEFRPAVADQINRRGID